MKNFFFSPPLANLLHLKKNLFYICAHALRRVEGERRVCELRLGVFAECVPEPCVTASPRLLQLSQPQLAGLLAEKADLRAGERNWKERWKALCWKALPRDGGQTLDASLRPAAQPDRA
jgi:hypothetical protein